MLANDRESEPAKRRVNTAKRRVTDAHEALERADKILERADKILERADKDLERANDQLDRVAKYWTEAYDTFICADRCWNELKEPTIATGIIFRSLLSLSLSLSHIFYPF